MATRPKSFINPQTDCSTMANLIKIAEVKDLTPGQAGAFDVEAQRIALFNVEGTFYAVGDTCSHRGGPLSKGSVAGTIVPCPWHGAAFDLKTGAVMRPPAPQGVPSYRVVIDGGDVKIEIKAIRQTMKKAILPRSALREILPDE
jgi:nitrite reductase/ring-hydroxylating ferredoxin subunit